MYHARKSLKAHETHFSGMDSAGPGHCFTLVEDSPADADQWDTGFCCCRVTD